MVFDISSHNRIYGSVEALEGEERIQRNRRFRVETCNESQVNYRLSQVNYSVAPGKLQGAPGKLKSVPGELQGGPD